MLESIGAVAPLVAGVALTVWRIRDLFRPRPEPPAGSSKRDRLVLLALNVGLFAAVALSGAVAAG